MVEGGVGVALGLCGSCRKLEAEPLGLPSPVAERFLGAAEIVALAEQPSSRTSVVHFMAVISRGK